jgi:Flp pilus assembly protein TadD
VTWNNKGVALKALGRIKEGDAALTKAKALGYKGKSPSFWQFF